MSKEKDVFQSLKAVLSPILNIMVDIEKEGLENISESGGRILIGNHRSDMDPFVIASILPHYISWVAAEYTKRIPVFDQLVKNTGVIPMEIDGNVSVSSIKKLMSVLKAGEILGIFPEGHDYMVKNNFSGPMVDWHGGFAVFAYRAKVPVTPFVIVPLEEEVSAIPVAPSIRQMIGLPEEVAKIPLRCTYKKVKVVFEKSIMPDEYRAYPEKEAIPFLLNRCRQTMEQIMQREGMPIS
ncbi:MAG: 1-acyl-sn-glycerol-3-phosphate acyltransferase [Leptonema sp. (in: Bacteria)]|nr:1-acyl-sn-glycerol-3-phosphate acyltransferase [Leptonema sp. (in: bacteria)]